MNQKKNRSSIFGMIACLGIAVGCTTPKSTPLFVFDGKGKVDSVDILKRDIYIDTTKEHDGSNVCLVEAYEKGEAYPTKGDSIFFHVDSTTKSIDMFTIKKNK